MSPDDHRHGTPRGYALKCRCVPCSKAKAAANAAERSPEITDAQATLAGGTWELRPGSCGVQVWVPNDIPAGLRH